VGAGKKRKCQRDTALIGGKKAGGVTVLSEDEKGFNAKGRVQTNRILKGVGKKRAKGNHDMNTSEGIKEVFCSTYTRREG